MHKKDVISLGKLLYEEFNIPNYQRTYEWSKENVYTLLNDINDNYVKNEPINLGSIIIYNNEGKYDLVDGQQRITTLYLIAIACGKIKSADDIILKSEYDELINEKNGLTNLLEKKNNISEKLTIGYRIIEKILNKKLKDEKDIWSFFEKVYYYEINLDKNIDINHYFEVMNSRGVQLSRSDIVKSILMQHLSNDEDKYKLNNLWYVYEKMNDSNKYKSFSSFKGEKIENKTINEILINYNVDNNISKKDAYYEVEDNSILNFDYFLLYVIRLYQKIGVKEDKNSGEFNLDDLTKEYKEYFSHKNSEEVVKFLNFMVDVKNIYDKYVVKYDEKNEDWTLKVKDEDMKLIQSCLRVSFTNRKLMHWLYLTLKYFYDDNNKNDINGYKDKMRSYIKKEYIKEFIYYAKQKKYKTGFNTPNIVLNYLDFLIKENIGDVVKKFPEANDLKYDDFKFKFRNSIEHFEPRKGENVSENHEWIDDFGNLALLAYKTNTKIQNASPEDKAEHFKNNLSEYSLKLQIMTKITLVKGWNKNNMEVLRKEMIELLEEDLKSKKVYSKTSNSGKK